MCCFQIVTCYGVKKEHFSVRFKNCSRCYGVVGWLVLITVCAFLALCGLDFCMDGTACERVACCREKAKKRRPDARGSCFFKITILIGRNVTLCFLLYASNHAFIHLVLH